MRPAARKAAIAVRNGLRRRGIEIVRTTDTLLGAHLFDLFRRLEIDVVLDVGARIGEYGDFVRECGYRGRIVSFEPVERNVVELQHRAQGDPLWEVQPIALGTAQATAEINVTSATQYSSFRGLSSLAFETFPTIGVESTERVEVRPLADLWDAIIGGGRSVFLKTDTQGWDLEVLRGAGRRLDAVAALQTEVAIASLYDDSPTLPEMLVFLEEKGFGASGFFPVARSADGRLVEMDCAAVRSGAA